MALETLETFSTVNSRAITARQPSVPNFIDCMDITLKAKHKLTILFQESDDLIREFDQFIPFFCKGLFTWGEGKNCDMKETLNPEPQTPVEEVEGEMKR